jgi:hypothetical protein
LQDVLRRGPRGFVGLKWRHRENIVALLRDAISRPKNGS